MAHVREVARKGSKGYEVRWRAGDKFRQRTFKVKRDADRFALKVETELAEGNTTELLVKNGRKVRQVIEASLAASKPELKPRTYNGYVAIYERRILPRFGSRRIGTVTRADVQAWIAELHGAGLAPATVHHHYVALKKVMRYAMDDRLISYNPCDGVRLPKNHDATGFKPVFLTTPQVEALAGHLDALQPYGLLVRFAAYTGLRAAELTGLRIRDLNLQAGHVEVRQTLQHIKGEWVIGTPKSARSTRNVPLVSRALVAELREYLVTHSRSGDPDALVWPGRNPGSHAVAYERVFDVASFRRNYLKPALRSLTMYDGMRFHDLRHTFASLMLAAEFPPYEVSRWMGHANLATTDSIYAHLYPSDYSSHLDRFEAFVNPA